MGLQDWIRSTTLFLLGATLPFLGLALLALLGIALLVLPLPWYGLPALPAGIFLLVNALYGLRLVMKSFARPPGRRLHPGEAPELEARLEEVRRTWKGPGNPELVLAPDAWSVELTGVPVAGVFGWCRYHWYIGIYPLLALSLREFEAVVGWESVFWSAYQGWFNLQAKRLASLWFRIHLHLETRAQGGRAGAGLASVFLRPYARWVVGAFQPFLAREFLRTDRAIAETHGTQTLARALCRLAILKPLVARRVFAPWDACIEEGRPLPEDLYEHLSEVLGRAPEAAEGMLELALDGLCREAPPLLRLRLEYLEVPPRVPLPPGAPAFRTLLGGTGVMEEVHRVWKDRLEAHLQETGRRKSEERRRFQELARRMPGRFPDHPDAGEFLNLAFEYAPWEEFDALLWMFREAHPGSVPGAFLAIRRSLQRGRDHSAVLEARNLLRQEPLLAQVCHEVLAHHLGGRGDLGNADKEWDRAQRAGALAERARLERLGASPVDPLEPHGCTPGERERIRTLCRADDRIREAYLVRKKVAFHAECPVFLLVVGWRGPWWDPGGRKRRAFQKELQGACPFPADGTGFVVVAGRVSLGVHRRKLSNLGGLLFRR